MLGALTDQIGRCFGELMEELRGIREELSLLRTANVPIPSMTFGA